jgi:hypothetical protein
MRKILLGVAMSAVMMLLLACGGAQLKTVTFNSNATCIAPSTTTRLESMSGYGAAGQPESPGDWGYDVTIVTKYYKNGVLQSTVTSSDTVYYESAPADYCNGSQNSNGESSETCYYHSSFDNSSPATTGASTRMTGPSGFSRTFPGGTGGPASVTTFSNVTVNPNGSYSVVVPAGGSLTITYLE